MKGTRLLAIGILATATLLSLREAVAQPAQCTTGGCTGVCSVQAWTGVTITKQCAGQTCPVNPPQTCSGCAQLDSQNRIVSCGCWCAECVNCYEA